MILKEIKYEFQQNLISIGNYSTTPSTWTGNPDNEKVMQGVGSGATGPKIVESTNSYTAADLLNLLTQHRLSQCFQAI